MEFIKCKTRREAIKRCPWAAVIVDVCGGYIAFEREQDWVAWREQQWRQRKGRTMYSNLTEGDCAKIIDDFCTALRDAEGPHSAIARVVKARGGEPNGDVYAAVLACLVNCGVITIDVAFKELRRWREKTEQNGVLTRGDQ